MHGSLLEWCNDWWGTYSGAATDPVGVATGEWRVYRGGYWGYIARYCRSAARATTFPNSSSGEVGFRPVRSAL
jgi:formylglycine-generating enzyme required for sulfatase activity